MTDNQFGATMHQAGREARETVGNAASGADDMAKRVGTAATDAGEAVRDAARKVYGAAGDFGQQAMERGGRYGKSAVAQVESQPMTAVLVAAAVGFVAGLLLVRR